MIQKIRVEWQSLSFQERLFIFSAMICGFCISAEYAVIRPVSNSVFIATYSSSGFPYAWLALVPFNLFIIALYNKYLPRWGCFKMYVSIASAVVGVNILCACFLKTMPWLAFLLYVWKEIYVMLMFQQLWSVIHSTIPFQKAKYLYGILFGIGALGAATGSLIPGYLAVQVGSEKLLFATAGIYAILTLAYRMLISYSGNIALKPAEAHKENAWQALKKGIDLISNSKFLIFILLIVVFMQISSSLIDFQFNHFLEKAIPSKDLRTAYTAKIMGLIHMVTILFQFIGSFLLVHFLGFKKSHLLIPAVLILNACSFLLFPTFAVISLSFITIKIFDFSIFGVIKEMLYIPLKPEEKFQAKAIIDVVAYRSSKAVASLLILGIQWMAVAATPSIISSVAILIFLLWALTVLSLFKVYREVGIAN